MNWFDRLVAYFSPMRGLKRQRARVVAQEYEAAGRGRRTESWRGPSGDANAVSSMSLARMRQVSRDLARNNGWAGRGIRSIVNATVGAGIENQVLLDDKPFPDGQKIWDGWAETVNCDFDGRLNWFGLQALIDRTIVLSGGALIIKERANSRDGLPLTAPVRIQVREPDHLDDNKTRHDGRVVERGIELDGRGRRLAYWLFPHHPGSRTRHTMTSVRVPASDVIHVYEVIRPGQLRGIPWLHSAITTLQELDGYVDSRLMQARVAALFGISVTDINGDGVGAAGPVSDDPGGEDKLEAMQPGMINYLDPGQDIKAADPPRFDSAEAGFAQLYLRMVAAAIGVPYEVLTGDFRDSNFSAARMARLGFQANVDVWRWHMLIPLVCNGVFRWVMELAAVPNQWPGVPTAIWTPPSMPSINPLLDAQTKTTRVRGGHDAQTEVWRAEGKDPEVMWDEIEAAQKEAKKRGVVLDTDPSQVTMAGQFQVVTD